MKNSAASTGRRSAGLITRRGYGRADAQDLTTLLVPGAGAAFSWARVGAVTGKAAFPVNCVMMNITLVTRASIERSPKPRLSMFFILVNSGKIRIRGKKTRPGAKKPKTVQYQPATVQYRAATVHDRPTTDKYRASSPRDSEPSSRNSEPSPRDSSPFPGHGLTADGGAETGFREGDFPAASDARSAQRFPLLS
jgi:hypothetical protein